MAGDLLRTQFLQLCQYSYCDVTWSSNDNSNHSDICGDARSQSVCYALLHYWLFIFVAMVIS